MFGYRILSRLIKNGNSYSILTNLYAISTSWVPNYFIILFYTIHVIGSIQNFAYRSESSTFTTLINIGNFRNKCFAMRFLVL